MKPLIHHRDTIADAVRRIDHLTPLPHKVLLVVPSRHLLEALVPYGFIEATGEREIDHRSACTRERMLRILPQANQFRDELYVFMWGTSLIGNCRTKTSRLFQRFNSKKAVLYSDLGFDPAKAYDIAVACGFHRELGGNREEFRHKFCVGDYVTMPNQSTYWRHQGMKNLAELANIFRKHIDKEVES